MRICDTKNQIWKRNEVLSHNKTTWDVTARRVANTPSVSYYLMFYSNAQRLRKTILLSKISLNYNIKLIYLIINKNKKNSISYTVFDKVKVT